MTIEKKILDFVKSKKKNLEIAGLRGIVKTGENEWSFRFTFREKDFLSVSKLFKVKLSGIEKTPTFISEKIKVKKVSKIIKQEHGTNK